MSQKSRSHLLALCRTAGTDWSYIAREAQRPGGLQGLHSGRVVEQSPAARKTLKAIADGAPDASAMASNIKAWAEAGFQLVTVLDEDYPLNLRRIPNLPPFLFYRGTIRRNDLYSVAVVGTRQPSAEGLRRARRLAGALAARGVTVLSGLARGIDTAAHKATLAANGRTIAVLGSGLMNIYPSENDELADQIAKKGAVVSQFWPDAPPARFNFPRRNVVMSGLGQGTAVIEASATSGAKMQARFALEHGKQVFLLESLVHEHAWARDYVQRGAITVHAVDDIVAALRPVEALEEATRDRLQLTLRLA